MRGYFGIGIWGGNKPMNAGNLFRTAHAFGAGFVFTIAADYSVARARSDTSLAPRNVPWYDLASLDDLRLPHGCDLVGVELTPDAVELPSFPHPLAAAYLLGPERGALPPDLLARCRHVVKIPTAFSLNVATAGAIVLYDRVRTLGRFGERPVASRARPVPPPPHVHGGPIRRRKR